MTADSPSDALIETFFDPATGTLSHLVLDPATRHCALIDTVLDFDAASGRTGTASAERLLKRVRALGAEVEWILETHVHADHLSAAPWLRQQVGGRIGIGRGVTDVQAAFGPRFNAGPEFARDGRQFDHLFEAGERFRIGRLPVEAWHVPGHTAACTAYVVAASDPAHTAAFVGDTLFMPDVGTARCDFPGGDARTLHRSVRRLLDGLPAAARLYPAHDYPPEGREVRFAATVAEQRRTNIHVHDGIDEAAFVTLRRQRDAGLPMPALMLPAVQVNMRAGQLPEPESNGVRYLKIPLDAG